MHGRGRSQDFRHPRGLAVSATFGLGPRRSRSQSRRFFQRRRAFRREPFPSLRRRSAATRKCSVRDPLASPSQPSPARPQFLSPPWLSEPRPSGAVKKSGQPVAPALGASPQACRRSDQIIKRQNGNTAKRGCIFASTPSPSGVVLSFCAALAQPRSERIASRRYNIRSAPVAQLDRAAGFEPVGREFESLRARQKSTLNQSPKSKFPISAREAKQRGHTALSVSSSAIAGASAETPSPV
jgi:hypothetical protein